VSSVDIVVFFRRDFVNKLRVSVRGIYIDYVE
jgi:hypothetical protein